MTRCTYPKCVRRASFGLPGGKATRCAGHRQDNYRYIMNRRRCIAMRGLRARCTKQPSFGPPGPVDSDNATYCAEHRPDGYQDVRNKRCVAWQVDLLTRCDKQPTFGPPGARGSGATHCAGHRPDGYQNVVTKRCAGMQDAHTRCAKTPSFGPPGAGSGKIHAVYCAQHRPDGYQDIKNRRCAALTEQGRCVKHPSFGPPGAGMGRIYAVYCADHRPDGYRDVVTKRCACGRLGTYTLPGLGTTFCTGHAPEGAVNKRSKKTKRPGRGVALTGVQAVKSMRCVAAGCSQWAAFGPPGAGLDDATHCAEHCSNGYCAAGC